MKRLLLILQLGLIAITCNVNASIINSDTDDYKAYKDTETGLVWLDFGENNNQSYNYVASQLGALGEWEGWRLPTLSEVYTMWANVADLENVDAFFESPDYYGEGQLYAYDRNSNLVGADDSVWEDVFDLIGFNRSQNIAAAATLNDALGYFDGTAGLSYVFFYDSNVSPGNPFNDSDQVGLYDNVQDGNLGNVQSTEVSTLLVRQADSPTTDLPAPSTIAILGLGLLGLVARRKLF